MVYLSTSEEWQRQSALLLQARPTTARITTKYKIPNLDSPKYQRAKKRKREDEDKDKTDGARKIPKAVLVLKTYDPESGVVLKFKTDRAADVGRLISGLGRLGRHMAALPEKIEAPQETVIEDIAPPTEPTPGTATPKLIKESTTPAADGKTQPSTGGGGGKKKKKGKK